MKGIVCEEIGRFAYREDLPEPTLEAGHAVVRIRRIGICGTDLHAYRGNQPYFVYPRILGHELSATIEQIGENAEGLQAGDLVSIIPYLHCGTCRACRSGLTNCCRNMRVFGVHVDGGMRERVSIPVANLLRADKLNADQAAMLEPLAIGAHAVRRSSAGEGDTVLVIGAGPIGLGVMAMARFAGASVVAMDVNDERLAFAQEWASAEHAVNALQEPEQALDRLTDGDFFTHVIDSTGSLASMQAAFGYVGHGGTLTYVGLAKGTVTFDDPHFHAREMTVQGSRNATREDFARVLDAIGSGHLDVNGYISHRCAFEEMVGRFEDWLRPESKLIKAIVEMD
ncbi:alcohol dehydrogenase [Saccharibacillus sp. O23]|uniref:zinc-binding alcohol dehydrogenase family protein n=1 Tax=Saccharibacillus sp. O23 TaxID=2009338 RepID=UPI000B4E6E22|nr:zinc-binding alcohol dehydrogenase family protein [Saccharibacillus sp. O23]OWR32439.1 alcohol dehydrogenase [Saccharibacillus sp. O23]